VVDSSTGDGGGKKTGSSTIIVVVIAMVVLVLLAAIGAAYWYVNQNKKNLDQSRNQSSFNNPLYAEGGDYADTSGQDAATMRAGDGGTSGGYMDVPGDINGGQSASALMSGSGYTDVAPGGGEGSGYMDINPTAMDDEDV